MVDKLSWSLTPVFSFSSLNLITPCYLPMPHTLISIRYPFVDMEGKMACKIRYSSCPHGIHSPMGQGNINQIATYTHVHETAPGADAIKKKHTEFQESMRRFVT